MTDHNVNQFCLDQAYKAATDAQLAIGAVWVAKGAKGDGLGQDGADRYACGFAWVDLNPQAHPFVKWLKLQIKEAGYKYVSSNLRTLSGAVPNNDAHRDVERFGHPGYPKGWQFWKPGIFNGQNIDTHVAGAEAFAASLKAAFPDLEV